MSYAYELGKLPNITMQDLQQGAAQLQNAVQTGANVVQNVVGSGSSSGMAITKVEPGSAAVGSPVIIKGAGFVPGSTVFVGGLPANNTTVLSPTMIQIIVPPAAPGRQSVKVLSPDGKSVDGKDALEVIPAAGVPMVISSGPDPKLVIGGLAVAGLALYMLKKGK